MHTTHTGSLRCNWRQLFTSVLLTATTALAGPAERYIDIQLLVARSVEAKLDRVSAIADESAKRLIAGGNIYLAGEKGMVSELLGRAGGLCAAKALPLNKPLPAMTGNDVVILSDYGQPGTLTAALEKLTPTGALVIIFASGENPILQRSLAPNVRAVPVDIPLECCLAKSPAGEPLISVAGPALATAQWTYVAELLGACRRQDKQLAIYLSIFLDEGRKRYARTKGLMFEPDLHPAPVPRGQYGRAFLAQVTQGLQAIRSNEIGNLRKAATWFSEAIAAKKQIVRNLMGHLPPAEAGSRGDLPFFTQMNRLMGEPGEKWIRENLHKGDLYFFLGYQQNEDAMSSAANALGARTIFFMATPPGPDQAKNPLHLYIKPGWPMTDACLELSGYDVKACPLSCILGMTCYYAIGSEVVQK